MYFFLSNNGGVTSEGGSHKKGKNIKESVVRVVTMADV
jgi:hypothetical protein